MTHTGRPVMTIRSRRMRGFSLVELMVALVAGVIVSTAVVAFTLSSMKSNGEYVQSTRLTQELRNTLDLVTRELRRSGYDQNALKYLATGNASPFSRLKVDDSVTVSGKTYYRCVIYSYDTSAGVPGTRDTADGEIRAIRWKSRTVDGKSVGVVEFAQSSGTTSPACDGASPDYSQYPVACDSTSHWCAMSDPKVLDITQFYLYPTITSAASSLQVRQIDVTLKGRIAGTTDTERQVESTVKIRSDCYDATISNCSKTPDPNS